MQRLQLTSNGDINEKLTSIINMFDSYRNISQSSSVTLSERRRRTQFAPLLGALQDTVFLAPDAWPRVRHD